MSEKKTAAGKADLPKWKWDPDERTLTRSEGDKVELVAHVSVSEQVEFATDEMAAKFRMVAINKLRKFGVIPAKDEELPTGGEPKDFEKEPEIPPEKEPEPEQAPVRRNPPVSPDTMEEQLKDCTPEQRKAIRRLRIEAGFPPDKLERPTPKAPPRGKFGSKTPDYVLWALRYHPGRFATKYGVIGEGSIDTYKTVVDEHSQAKRKKFVVAGVLSEAKTHITLKRPTASLSSLKKDDLEEL